MHSGFWKNHQFSSPQSISHQSFYQNWQALLSDSIVTAEELARFLPIDAKAIKPVTARYSLRINKYYLSLIRTKDDPIWKQVVPNPQELADCGLAADPLGEELQAPAYSLIHRYPDRVVWAVTNQCAAYCRFCMRKRKVGLAKNVDQGMLEQGLAYIRDCTAIHEVIVSGGDPLLLQNDNLERILVALYQIAHVEIIRIHTRVPCTLPQRISRDLAETLRRFHPLFIMTHFNHPREITPAAAQACAILADAGIPLGCQTVLLKGVNDDPLVMKALMRQLVKIRVKPYYIHHPDLVRGTAHLRCSIPKGLEIMQALQGHNSGLCVPHYMIDLPNGGGKIPLLPEYIHSIGKDSLKLTNYRGEVYSYPLR